MKPYKGEIHSWSILQHNPKVYSIYGRPVGHPSFVNWIRTSPVIERNGDMVETHNSRYKLVGEEQPLPEFFKR